MSYFWYQSKSSAKKEAKRWVKHAVSSSKSSKEEAIFEFNCIFPSLVGGYQLWNQVVNVEVSETLKRCQSLNWWPMATTLYAVHVKKDSSLYHSISVSLWGILDSKSIVANLVKSTLKQHFGIWERRFRRSQVKQWKLPNSHECPERIFVIANILQRPIIVVSDASNTTQPDGFSGIFLPVMSKPIDCCKTPIFLAYCNNYVYPLLAEVPNTVLDSEGKYQILFPIIKNGLITLPIRFLVEKEEMKAGEILQDYLIMKEIDTMTEVGLTTINFLQSDIKVLPQDKNVTLDYVKTHRNSLTESSERGWYDEFPSKNIPNMTTHNLPGGVGKTEKEPTYSINRDSEKSIGMAQQIHGSYSLGISQKMEPTAPPTEEKPAEPLSMMNDNCIACKLYKSSYKTFPLCHECFEIKNRPGKVTESNYSYYKTNRADGSLVSSDSDPRHGLTSNTSSTPVSVVFSLNEQNKFINPALPTQTTFTKVETPKPSSNDIGNQIPNFIKTTPSPLLISTVLTNRKGSSDLPPDKHILRSLSSIGHHDNSMKAPLPVNRSRSCENTLEDRKTDPSDLILEDDCPQYSLRKNVAEIPCKFVSSNLDTKREKVTRCASPVCDELINPTDQLCPRCVKILMAHHHQSSCHRSCCMTYPDVSKESHSSKSSPNVNSSNAKFSSTVTSTSSDDKIGKQLDKKKEPDVSGYNQHSEDYRTTPKIVEDLENYEFQDGNLKLSSPQTLQNHYPKSLMVTSMTSARDSYERFSKDDELYEAQLAEIANQNKKPTKQCKNSHCFNFGNKDKDYYCNVCYSVKTNPSSEDFVSMESSSSSSSSTSARKCVTALCSNYANKLKDGFCNQCYSLRLASSEAWHHCGDDDGVDECDGLHFLPDNNNMGSDEGYWSNGRRSYNFFVPFGETLSSSSSSLSSTLSMS